MPSAALRQDSLPPPNPTPKRGGGGARPSLAALGTQFLPHPTPPLHTPLPSPHPARVQLVFTRSATGALDMVGQLMPWSAPAGGSGWKGSGGGGGGEEGSGGGRSSSGRGAADDGGSSLGGGGGGGSTFLYTRSNHNSALGEARAG